MLEETAPLMAELVEDDDEDDAEPLVFKCTRMSSFTDDPVPLQMVLPPPPFAPAPPKRKRTGRTKSVAK